MDTEFFEHSLLTLEKRYVDILALHDARLNSNSLELEELSSSAKSQIDELTRQLEAKEEELQKVVGERDARATENREALKLIEKLNKELQTKIAAASKVD